MITSEERKNAARYAGDVAGNMKVLAGELDRCCAPAKDEIEKDRRVTAGMAVSFEEWRNLIDKKNKAADETVKLFAEEADVYELYDKSGALMKVLDDIGFQMNLLRFLTGVEIARMGIHGAPFSPILKDLAALCENEARRKELAEKLVSQIDAMIRAEIRREAADCWRQAERVINAAVTEGDSLTEKLNTLVVKMGKYGRGFSLIAKETEKATANIRGAEGEIHRLGDSAFKMNLNAFNAAVEAARSGQEPDCLECAEGLRVYAGTLHRACKKCDELNKKHINLTALLSDENKNTEDSLAHKHINDIIFQGDFLNTQLSLESERASRADFQTFSRDFEAALDAFKEAEALKVYSDKLEALIERGSTVAKDAGAHGAGIAYILNEFTLFLAKCRQS
jgi:hypothetical protein